ncbi:MAG TPA: helix-turn-helix transcriptional regulator [Polyangiaceae bacterium]
MWPLRQCSPVFERFSAAVGLPPMEYLLAWRMAVAKDLLRHRQLDIAAVAERVGYASSSTFSTAFARHVGTAPGRYVRGVRGGLEQSSLLGSPSAY